MLILTENLKSREINYMWDEDKDCSSLQSLITNFL